METMTEVGRSLVSSAHFTMGFFSSGMVRSMKMRSRLGGHGKPDTLRTKGSAVMKRSTSACRMEERIALWEAVKFRFTGIFPAKMTARLAISPPLPGGRTMATRGLSVSALMNFESAMATGRIFEKGRVTSSEPSTSLSLGLFFNPMNSAVAREPLRMVRFEYASSKASRRAPWKAGTDESLAATLFPNAMTESGRLEILSMDRQDSRGQSMAMGSSGRPKAVSVLRWDAGAWIGVAGRAVALPGTKSRMPPSFRKLANSFPAEAGFLSALENIDPEPDFSMWLRTAGSWWSFSSMRKVIFLPWNCFSRWRS